MPILGPTLMEPPTPEYFSSSRLLIVWVMLCLKMIWEDTLKQENLLGATFILIQILISTHQVMI